MTENIKMSKNARMQEIEFDKPEHSLDASISTQRNEVEATRLISDWAWMLNNDT
jgi:hypothetical protein